MDERIRFYLSPYFIKKYNIEGTLSHDVDSLNDFRARMEYYYGMNMPITFNVESIIEGDIRFEYYTISDGIQTLIFPSVIEIPAEDPEWDDPYYISCCYYNDELTEEYEHKEDMDRIIILDRNVILLEKWEYWYKENNIISHYESDQVILLGYLTDADCIKLKSMGYSKNVIIDPEEQKIYRNICEEE